MFHLRCWISVGVDIGNLLELQRPFQSHREFIAPTYIYKVSGVLEFFRKFLDWGIQCVEFCLNESRQVQQGLGELLETVTGYEGEGVGKGEGYHSEDRDLTRKGFGGGHTDFRTDVNVAPSITCPGNRRAYDIAYSENETSRCLCQAHCCESVGCLS